MTDDPPDEPGSAPDDGYDGPAELVDGEAVTAVSVRLHGHFDPISGSYSWYGRVAADAQVTALVEGFGPAPFPVLDTLPPGSA